ncbi:MAG: serine hydrolase domain-containing protein [Planctomycetota bacterium]
MFKSLLYLCCAGIFILQPNLILAQSAEVPVVEPAEVGMSASKLAKVDTAMKELVAKKRLAGGVVAIARKGKIVHLKAYGKRDIEAELPMEKDTIFRIFSMTKSIVTAGALMLVEEGKVGLNDPVSKYIPNLKDVHVLAENGSRPAKNPITVADLMRHTSGYGYGWGPNQRFNSAFKQVDPLNTTVPLSEMAAKLDQIPLLFEPGRDWTYGISIDILGRVIEVASGQKLSQFLKNRFFDPLDMKDTGFHVSADRLNRFANNYRSDSRGNLTLVDKASSSRYQFVPPFEGGGGGLVSTARDYLRFLLMIQADGEFQGKRYLKPETVTLMKTNQVPKSVGWIKFGSEVRTGVGYSFGFSVRSEMSSWDPGGKVGEYGWGGMASTHYWCSPEDDLTVVTMEQIVPYSFMTEFKLKKLIYDAIED